MEPGMPHLILALVAAQRLGELWLATRNTRALLARGGREVGAAHYPLFVLLHGGWLASLFVAVPAGAPVDMALLGLFVLLQLCRLWVIATLGRYWTTRIITVPDAPLIRHGPYRLMRHPNYAVVTAEIAVLPLVFGAWGIALLFTVLNAALLLHRIRVEEAALADRSPPAPAHIPASR